MKKILTFALALLMLVSMAACGAKTAELSAEEEVEKVVVDFSDALSCLDVEKMLTYVDEKSDVYASFAAFGDIFNLEAMRSKLSPEMATAEMEPVFENFFEDMKDVLTSNMAYEVGGITVDGDTATAEITIAVPQADSISIDEYLAKYDQTKILEIMIGLFTEEELASFASLSSEEANEVVVSKMPATLETVFDEIVAAVEADLEVEEGTSVYTLNKIDGKWLIVDAK